MRSSALVIDPNRERAELTARVFTQAGISVRCLRDGQEALSILGTNGVPKYLVTELALAHIDGFTLIRRLRGMLDGETTRVVVLSAFAVMREAAVAQRGALRLDAVLTTYASARSLEHVLGLPLSGAFREEEDAPPSTQPDVVAARRMRSLERAGVLRNRPSDVALELVVRRVARRFGVSVALVSLVLEDKQWFKARVGTSLNETPLDVSFCRHVVQAGEPMIVPDATTHPVFRSNGLVRDGIVRGYAGAPLIASDGEVWGSLCIIDPFAPLNLSVEDVDKLTTMAEEVVRELEATSQLT